MVAAVFMDTAGPAPLDPGAVMLVDADGNIEGAVTGGCVEAALFEEAQAVLDGTPPRVLTYEISDEQTILSDTTGPIHEPHVEPAASQGLTVV